jgi:hypothetical protein
MKDRESAQCTLPDLDAEDAALAATWQQGVMFD